MRIVSQNSPIHVIGLVVVAGLLACGCRIPEDELPWRIVTVEDALYIAPQNAGDPVGGVLAIATDRFPLGGSRRLALYYSYDESEGDVPPDEEPFSEVFDQIWRLNGTPMHLTWNGAFEQFDLTTTTWDIDDFDPGWYDRGRLTIVYGLSELPRLPDANTGQPTLSTETRIFFVVEERSGLLIGEESGIWDPVERVVYSADNVPIRIAP